METVVRSLVRVGTLAEMEARVVAGARELTGAGWAAYFRREAKQFVCGAAEGRGPAVGATLSRDAVVPLLQAGARPALAEVPLEGEWTARIVAPLELLEGARGLILLGDPPSGAASSGHALNALGRFAEAASAALQNAQLVEQLRSEVFLDHLTGCYNRRAFDEHLRVEMVRARRYRRPLALMMIDIDDFKAINDTLGHPVGDHALRCAGAAMLGAFRVTDVVCRYAGDEFAILFPETPFDDVLRLAERLRRQLGSLFPDSRVTRAVTASFGVAAYPRNATDGEELVRVADQALYRAKHDGKDRVVSAPLAAG